MDTPRNTIPPLLAKTIVGPGHHRPPQWVEEQHGEGAACMYPGVQWWEGHMFAVCRTPDGVYTIHTRGYGECTMASGRLPEEATAKLLEANQQVWRNMINGPENTLHGQIVRALAGAA
jgi:hypothetical protein